MSELEPTDRAPLLSAAGRARRDDMLSLLLAAQRRRVRARRATRAAGALAAAVVACSAAYLGATHGPASVPIAADGQRHEGATRRVASIVRTDSTILSRVAVSGTAHLPPIGDDELLGLLREAGRDDGIVRLPGRAFLTSELRADAGGKPGSDQAPGRL